MSGTPGFVLNLKGAGFEMMLDKGFKSAEELTSWMTHHASGFPKASFDVIKVKDLASAVSEIESKGGAMARFSVKGLKMLESVPGAHFVSKKAELILKLGGVVGATVGASGSAFAATGDFNKSAKAGISAGGNELNQTINPKNRFSNGLHNIADGRISGGLARLAEGGSDLIGLGSLPLVGKYFDADALEKDRILSATRDILKSSKNRSEGFSTITKEVISAKEDPKYILLSNDTLPKEHGSKPMSEALKDDKFFRKYEHSIEDRIEHSAGAQKDMWQGQLETIRGYRQALNAEQGVAMPRPAPALGMNFN